MRVRLLNPDSLRADFSEVSLAPVTDEGEAADRESGLGPPPVLLPEAGEMLVEDPEGRGEEYDEYPPVCSPPVGLSGDSGLLPFPKDEE